MSLLGAPRCPNCNSVVDLSDLRTAAPKGERGLVIDGVLGVICSTCGIKLRELQPGLPIASVFVAPGAGGTCIAPSQSG
jgi:hypothetical protein